MTRRHLLLGAAGAAAAQDGFLPLFNGRDLAGWEGDPALWSVRGGILTGTTDGHPIEKNTFLIYGKPFPDFHLMAEVRLRNHNSGIQFRSRVEPGPGWVVTGYQADFSEAGDNSAWGNFYEEQGRGRRVMRTPDEGWRKGRNLVKHGDWNVVEIIARGDRMSLKLNGEITVEVADDRAREGVIALQLHRGEPMKVEFRGIRLRKLEGGRS